MCNISRQGRVTFRINSPRPPGHIPDIARCPEYGQCLEYGQFSLSIFRTSNLDVWNMASKNCPYSGHQMLKSRIFHSPYPGHRAVHIPDIAQGRARVLDPMLVMFART